MDNTEPLVTVMIPTYNQERFIKKTINSVLAQTYQNIEVVISDDSSNNKTENIIKRNYLTNKKIRYFHNVPSLGKTNNYRHMLYDLVKGKYVLNLDGDDYLEDDKFIEDAINFINKHKLVMVIGKQKILKIEENKFLSPQNLKDEKSLLEGEQVFIDSIFKNFEIPHLATLYNVEIAKNVGFYEDDIISTDRMSLLKLSLHGKIGVFDRVVGVWVHHGNNISQNIDLDIIFKNINVYDELYKYALEYSNINKYILKIWKILAKYKSLYGFVFSSKDKNIIKKIIRSDYKLYGYLLLVDPRL